MWSGELGLPRPVDGAPQLPVTGCRSFSSAGGLRREYGDSSLYRDLCGGRRRCFAAHGRHALHPNSGSVVEIGSETDVLRPRTAARIRLSRLIMNVSTTAYSRFLNSVDVPAETLHTWCLADSRQRRSEYFPLRRTSAGEWEPRPGTARQPMILVSWFGANAYSLWANRRNWRQHRADESGLPSEAEWEYAARGPVARRYPWGDERPTPHVACLARHISGATYSAETLPAADVNDRLGVSPFGLHHMAGNVGSGAAIGTPTLRASRLRGAERGELPPKGSAASLAVLGRPGGSGRSSRMSWASTARPLPSPRGDPRKILALEREDGTERAVPAGSRAHPTRCWVRIDRSAIAHWGDATG